MQIHKTVLSKIEFPSLNPEKDTPLYKAARNVKNSETLTDRGTDLFVHTAPDGSVYYYRYHWSLYPNESNICQITSENCAHEFLERLEK